MDSLHTPLVNEDLIEYNKLYSEYMAMLVELHNYHTRFLKFTKVREKPGLRRHPRLLRGVAYTVTSERRNFKMTESELMRIYDEAYMAAPSGSLHDGARHKSPSKKGAGLRAVWNAALDAAINANANDKNISLLRLDTPDAAHGETSKESK